MKINHQNGRNFFEIQANIFGFKIYPTKKTHFQNLDSWAVVEPGEENQTQVALLTVAKLSEGKNTSETIETWNFFVFTSFSPHFFDICLCFGFSNRESSGCFEQGEPQGCKYTVDMFSWTVSNLRVYKIEKMFCRQHLPNQKGTTVKPLHSHLEGFGYG